MAISTIGASGLDSTVSQIGKNILHNGAMTVAQRGTVVSPTNGFTLDRWHAQVAGAAAITVSQDTDVPSGQDFSYSLKVDVTTLDSSIAASDRVHIRQVIEAQNLQHLRYGDASAKTLSLTWWMKSPKSGTHCVALYQDDGARSYVREVTVSSADTWEKFTVTFPGDASGTINNDNGAGLYVTFPLAAGTDFHATADAWAAGFDFATSNQQNLVDSAANNFYITGVQLEVGSVATDFEHEDISTTLAKCQRYFQRFSDLDAGMAFANGHAITTTRTRAAIMLPVRLRDETYGGFSFAFKDINHISVRQTNAAYAASSVTTYASAAGQIVFVDLTVATMPNAGMAVNYESDTNNTYFEVSAEI
jgi:hypothetical protein